MDELTREFLIESQEGLDRMERCLTVLEERPEDPDLLAEIFRAVHTIKGTTGFLGFKRLEKLAHVGENLLGLIRDRKLAVSAAIITGQLQLLDGLRSILKTIETDGNEGLASDGELIRNLQSLQEPVLVTVSKSDSSSTSPSVSHLVRESRVRQRTKVPPKGHSGLADTSSGPAETLEPTYQDRNPSNISQVSSAAESTLRVDVAVLNRMMNLVGELVLTRNQVLQATSGDSNMRMLCRRLDMVTADLRESVMKARMQPVSNVFSKMPRIVRDLSHALNRQVHLEIEGQDTELDKCILEAIKDPITHAIRNALDHGIESSEARRAAGKEPVGTLRLRAAQEGSHVVIEVCDDGAGISFEKVRSKAIERGIISADRAAQLSDRELHQLVFLPGFSTAGTVTNVSGRGVGMDVVRTNVENIGGKVEIESRAGKGTTLRLRIPLTLAIIPALIVRSLKQSFAVPQSVLSELVHISGQDGNATIEWIDRAPLFRLRGKLLPLIFLDRMLLPSTDCRRLENEYSFIAVLDADGRRFGLVVDGLADPEEIVVKPLSSALKGIALYCGSTVLGNGELALILDPGALAARAGITAVSEGEKVRESEDVTSKASQFLLVEIAGRKAAVPLSDVLRIERLSVTRIEYVRDRAVINFDGQLVPVEDAGTVILSAQSNSSTSINVVVCRDGKLQVGIVVSQVLDVAPGGELFEAGSNRSTAGVVLLSDCVTEVVAMHSFEPISCESCGTDQFDRTMESSQ